MQVLFLDDSRQRNCVRQKMGRLVAVGGAAVESTKARSLDRALEKLCTNDFAFPRGEPFKWSPGRNHWMRRNLQGDSRTRFFREVLRLAQEHNVIGQVVISDATKALATRQADTPEMDVLLMALERFNWLLQEQDDHGIVVVARPSGGRGDEDDFIASCADAVESGTDYAAFDRLATNPLTMPFTNSRLLQLADLIVSISTAMVAGHVEFAKPVFGAVKKLLRTSGGRIGGVGFKIHPDYSYVNLYHWILGDETFWRFQNGWGLPVRRQPYSMDGMRY